MKAAIACKCLAVLFSCFAVSCSTVPPMGNMAHFLVPEKGPRANLMVTPTIKRRVLNYTDENNYLVDHDNSVDYGPGIITDLVYFNIITSNQVTLGVTKHFEKAPFSSRLNLALQHQESTEGKEYNGTGDFPRIVESGLNIGVSGGYSLSDSILFYLGAAIHSGGSSLKESKKQNWNFFDDSKYYQSKMVGLGFKIDIPSGERKGALSISFNHYEQGDAMAVDRGSIYEAILLSYSLTLDPLSTAGISNAAN